MPNSQNQSERLVLYEELNMATWLLEIAIWKAKVEQETREARGGSVNRNICRITSGAEIIIPNVLSFLMWKIPTPIPRFWDRVDKRPRSNWVAR
mmetsp:Transcript_18504/g.38910  ORF Transcript_18504/g.38910 Transcript_18504/m.38910 type:complete len:94 (-) Transcript_18504:256-537(-)